jgi:hypothetical protein
MEEEEVPALDLFNRSPTQQQQAHDVLLSEYFAVDKRQHFILHCM